jgi:hypothetical protein
METHHERFARMTSQTSIAANHGLTEATRPGKEGAKLAQRLCLERLCLEQRCFERLCFERMNRAIAPL